MRSLLENSNGGALGERVRHERSRAFRVSVQRQRRTHGARGGCHLLRCRSVQRLSRSLRELTLPVDVRFVFLFEMQRFLVEQRRAALNFNVYIVRWLVNVGVKLVLLSRRRAAQESIRCNGIVHFSPTPISAKNYGECDTERLNFVAVRDRRPDSIRM